MAPKKSGKSVTPKELSMDDMRRLGMTDEQIQEITTLRRLTLEEKRVQKEQRDQAAMERERAARAAKREAERQAALQLEAAQQEALIRYAAKEREEELNRMAELRRLVEERRRLIDEAKETLLEIDETDREWSEAEERHLYEIALAEREARERGVAKPRSVHRDVLLSRCCRDPLFATMALVLYAERLVKGSPRLPPISPMMMQMVNTHSEEWIPVGKLSDDDMRSSPRWNHYVQCCGDVGAIRLMKPLARLRGIMCNQLPSLDLMRTISYHGARTLHAIDLSFTGPKVDIDWTSPVQDKDDDFRRTLQWLGSLSHLRAVTLRGSLVGSVAGLELLPRLTHLSLSGTMVTDVNVLAAAQGLRVLDLSHTPVTSDGIRNLYHCEALEDLNLNFCSNDLYIHALTRSSSIRRLGCRRSHVPRPDPDGLEYARVACRIATIEVIEVSQITCDDVGPICAKRPPVELIIDLGKSFNVFKQFPALLPFMPSLQIASTNSNFDSVTFDWSRFNHLTEVAVVSRFNHAVIDLNRLAELTSLQILHLDHQTSAVGSLKRARLLQELTLLQCSASATDQILHDLCFLPRLEKVECVSCDLKTLTIFNGCERLKSLRIEGCTSLLREDKAFVNVPLLERIVIKECEKFTDAQSLLSLPSIAHLTLTKTGVIDEKIFERQVELLSQKRLYNSWFKTHSSNEDQP